MEIDNVCGVRPEDGSVDVPRGSTEDIDAEGGESNVITIADFESLDIEVIDRSKEPGFIANEIKQRLRQLQDEKYLWTAPELRDWHALITSDWLWKQCSLRVRLAVLNYPPFYLYRLQSTGHHAVITSYEEAKPKTKDRYAKGEITCSVKLESLWNADLLNERMIAFTPLTDLIRLKHIEIAKSERIVSSGAI
jgi:hypothetical protein